ncbi:MAG: hypothetical protein IT475_15940 [Aquimonas sp.]|nr:hypothetical protein [Aquimonas sp.]
MLFDVGFRPRFSFPTNQSNYAKRRQVMRQSSAIVGVLLCMTQVATAAPRDDVIEAFDAVMAAGKYRVEVATVTGKREHVMQLDVELPNRFHLRSPESEMILLPTGSWMRMDQQWMRMPVDMSKTVEAFTMRAIEDGKASLRDVSMGADAIVAGCEARVYEYRQSGKIMGVQSEAEVEMAVCKDTGLPSQIVTRSGSERKPTVVTSIYDFAAEISIEAP